MYVIVSMTSELSSYGFYVIGSVTYVLILDEVCGNREWQLFKHCESSTNAEV